MENLLVYHVDIGQWITCDFSLLNKTVSELKYEIEKKTDIPVAKQVLLVSGGGLLDPFQTVSFYCAGTDTSPFYLFSKMLIDQSNAPSAYFDTLPEIDFKKEFNRFQGMPSTIDSLNLRVSLAQQYSENAQCNLSCIEILIHDQHMMHQGWLAAVANMMDTVEKFKFKADIFKKDFKCYLDKREDSINLLNKFDDILLEISKIPMLPALLENNSEEKDRVNNSSISKKSLINQSLLEWVTARNSLENLEHIVEHCKNSLQQFDEEMLNAVLQEVCTMNEYSCRSDCSEIKGLEHRLFKLAQMMDESKRLRAEQLNIAEVLKMNHIKASDESDISVISILIASHDKQLELMEKNNLRLCDIRNRSILAKQELCNNLHPRLKWLIVIENKVSDIEALMLLYSDSIKLTREYLDVVEQLQNTPKLYFNAVAEVVRRRIFSQALLIWSSDLACHMMERHSDEIVKRKNFQSQFEGHFLSQLFPGLEDLPPAFATQAPPIFDYNLPKLCLEDLDTLIKKLPDIARVTTVPNFNAITQFFLSKSIQEDGTLAIESNKNYDSISMETSNAILDADMQTIKDQLNKVMATVDLRTCKIDIAQDSDTINKKHSNMEKYSYSPGCFLDPHKNNTENPQENTVEFLKKNLYNLKNLANITINTMRSDLNIFKQYINQQNLEIKMFTDDLQTKYDIQTSHIHQLVQYVEESNREIDCLRRRIKELESIIQIHIKNEDQERQLRLRLENEKNECLQQELDHTRKEITHQLTMAHKQELEVMQARFKMVTQTTNMERSSSEQSFEKNKRFDVIELVNHESMIAQLKEDFLLEKEQAIQRERNLCEQKLAYERQLKYDEKKDNLIFIWDESKKITDNKNRSLQPHSNTNSITIPEWELDFSSASSSMFVDLCKSSSFEPNEGKLSVNSCNVGDFILIVWDLLYKNYTVYQENKKNLVFLHPDSIDNLSLKMNSDETPKLQHFSAEVIQKEYCQAVKEDNRYKVKKGMKFYRVKIQLLKALNHKRETSMSESSSISVTYVE